MSRSPTGTGSTEEAEPDKYGFKACWSMTSNLSTLHQLSVAA